MKLARRGFLSAQGSRANSVVSEVTTTNPTPIIQVSVLKHVFTC